jgi:hypothetical protein
MSNKVRITDDRNNAGMDVTVRKEDGWMDGKNVGCSGRDRSGRIGR